MAFVKTTAGRNACASGGWLAAMAGGSLRVYTTGHGTLLATFTLSSPAFGAPAVGVLTMAGGAKTATPAANGTAAVYDACQADTTVLGSGTVTAAGGGGDMTINNINVVTTSDVTLNTFTHTEPAS
jgi:hypothetical protein